MAGSELMRPGSASENHSTWTSDVGGKIGDVPRETAVTRRGKIGRQRDDRDAAVAGRLHDELVARRARRCRGSIASSRRRTVAAPRSRATVPGRRTRGRHRRPTGTRRVPPPRRSKVRDPSVVLRAGWPHDASVAFGSAGRPRPAMRSRRCCIRAIAAAASAAGSAAEAESIAAASRSSPEPGEAAARDRPATRRVPSAVMRRQPGAGRSARTRPRSAAARACRPAAGQPRRRQARAAERRDLRVASRVLRGGVRTSAAAPTAATIASARPF